MLRSLVIASLLLSGVAHAASEGHSSQSEFFFQSEAGQSELTPRVGYLSSTIETESGIETKSTGFNLGVAYEYGLNETWAVEAAINYGNLDSEINSVKEKSSGLLNPEFAFKGTSGMEWGHLRYGVIAELSLEKRKVTSATDDGNLATGGHALKPYVGADTAVGAGLLGARLSYEYKFDRTLDTGGVESKHKDGHEMGLSVFYEYMMTDVLLGASYNHISEGAVNDEDGNELEDSGTMTGISLYSRIPMEGWALIPRLDYDMSNSHFDKFNVMLFTVAARFSM